MKKENLILIGGGGHAKACIDVIEVCNSYNIIGYLDKQPSLVEYDYISYLGTDNEASKYVSKAGFLICIGQLDDGSKREHIFSFLSNLKAKFVTIISPTAYISKKTLIGAGTIVMHGVTIQTGVKIGMNCIINDKVLIEHDSTIGNHCHISTCSTVNGSVTISDNVFIGSGAILKNGIQIEQHSVIGMGATVLVNVEYGSTMVGNPARKIV